MISIPLLEILRLGKSQTKRNLKADMRVFVDKGIIQRWRGLQNLVAQQRTKARKMH